VALLVRRFSPLTTSSLLCILVAAALALGVAPPARADGTPLSCPNGATVWLEGQAPPNEALLAYLANRSVGGGSADRAGRFRIPLRLRERPGIYPVQVRLRAGGAVVARYECFVDVPLTEQPSPTPEIVVTAPVGLPPATPTIATQPAGPTERPTTTSTVSPTPTTRGGSTTATPTVTGTAQADQANPEDITIIEVIPGGGSEPESVTLFKNVDTPINIAGWRIVNASRSDQPTYTFPSYLVDEDNVVILYTGPGQRDPLVGDFYWGRSDNVWQVGDRAELRDPANRLIHAFTVLAPT